jgi:UDP-N-acetylmuramyl pentapeptide synthase
MNTLPEPIIDNIYRYKHQLEFRHVLDELTDNNDNLYFSTKKELIRYLQNNIDQIEYVILKSNRRISILEYLKMICRSRCRIFN